MACSEHRQCAGMQREREESRKKNRFVNPFNVYASLGNSLADYNALTALVLRDRWSHASPREGYPLHCCVHTVGTGSTTKHR